MTCIDNICLDMGLDTEEITHDFLPYFKVYKDNHIERYILNSRVSSGIDPITGVQTKDIVVSADPNIGGRIFFPKLDENIINSKKKCLPLYIHFHGGGFCTGSAFGPITKQSLINLVSLAQVVVFSVDYRLAPEHLLPTAYEDSWVAFQWAASHVRGDGPESWLNEYVDFDRVFLGGESSGANIAHDVAIRASVEPFFLEGLNLVGLLAIHPYFCNELPERVIQYLYPSCNRKHQESRLNPSIDPRLHKLACDKVLVCVAEKDRLRERGIAYYKALKTVWEGKIELVETLGEGHCFHLLDATSPNVDPFMAKVASFIK